MSHLDPEQLTLLALGESVASLADCAHLRSCAACTAELTDFQSTVRVARTAAAEPETLESPPERVWQSISAELGLTASADAAPPTDAPPRADAPPPAEPPGTPPSIDAADRPPRPRGGLRALWALAAVLVLVGGVGVAGWVTSLVNAPTQIAAAQLDAFPGHPGATGSADVEQSSDGTRRLVVTVGSEVVPDTYREVWLIRNDAGALISLGVLDGDSGSFAIPDGIDLAEYSLVDVSVEPIDGDPAHSGDSIVRGELSPA